MSTTLKVSNGDLDINEVTGMPSLISGVDKCSQDVAEVLMIDRKQTNRSGRAFRRAYGNELASLQTPMFFSGLVGKPLVARKVQEAIQSLIDMQDQDQNVTDDEHIDNIGRLMVEALDTTDFIYFVEVFVRSGSTVPPVSNLQEVKLNHQFALSGGTVDVPNGGSFVTPT
jgi:hypothetical protein